MLATMNPENEIFKKDYVKPKASVAGFTNPDLVSNTDGWFTDLPVSSKANKRTQQVNFANKEAQEAAKLQRMQKQQDILTDRIASQTARLTDLSAAQPSAPHVSQAIVSAQGNHSLINTAATATTAAKPLEESKHLLQGPNVIQNEAEVLDLLPPFEHSAAMGNTRMEGEHSDVTPVKSSQKVTMHTLSGHKQNALMKEAERATNQSLQRIAEGSQLSEADKKG